MSMESYVIHYIEEGQPCETICTRPRRRHVLPRYRSDTGQPPSPPQDLPKDCSPLPAALHTAEALHGWYSRTRSGDHGYDLYVREDGCLVKVTRTTQSPARPREIWADNHYAGVLVRKVQSNLKEKGYHPYCVVGRSGDCWLVEQRKTLEPQADGYCRNDSAEERETRRAFWEWMDQLDQ